MTFLAAVGYRARRHRRVFVDAFEPDEPRNKYGQWASEGGGTFGVTNAASTLRRFAQKNPAGARFVIAPNGDVGYGSSYWSTHTQISKETGIEKPVIHGWMSQKDEDKRFVAWNNSPEGIKAGVDRDETLPSTAHPFLGALEREGFRNAKLSESGYFDGRRVVDGYDPDEPRNERGEWSAGEAETSGAWSNFTSENDNGMAAVKEKVAKVCADLKFDSNKVKYDFGDRTFMLGGKMLHYGGSADISASRDGKVSLYINRLAPQSVPGVLSHEIEHIRFQDFMDARNKELNEITNLPRPTGQIDDVMSPDGSLNPPYDKQFPHYNAWNETYDKVPQEVFARSDGVSAYSKEYWDEWHNGKMSIQSAMHETLAEMLRVKYMTGKFPDHQYSGPLPKHNKSTEYPEGFSTTRGVAKVVSEGATAWRKLFRVINP